MGQEVDQGRRNVLSATMLEMKNLIKLGVYVTLIMLQLDLKAQTVDWFTGGNTSLNPGTSFLGTTDGVPINFRTNNLLRMRLYPTQNSTINGYTVPTDGFLGLSGAANFLTGIGPFTRLHLADNSGAAIINAQQFAFRDWQRNGITFTGNADHGYIGQEHNGTDTTDMVILWSNDFGSGQFSPDHLSIRFMSNDLGAATGASSLRGFGGHAVLSIRQRACECGIGDHIGGNILDPTITELTEIMDVVDNILRGVSFKQA